MYHSIYIFCWGLDINKAFYFNLAHRNTSHVEIGPQQINRSSRILHGQNRAIDGPVTKWVGVFVKYLFAQRWECVGNSKEWAKSVLVFLLQSNLSYMYIDTKHTKCICVVAKHTHTHSQYIYIFIYIHCQYVYPLSKCGTSIIVQPNLP